MRFSGIILLAFATGGLGDKVPTLPNLAAVADAVAPAVSDAPVFRGRGTDKDKEEEALAALVEAEAVAAEGDEDAALPPLSLEEAAALAEEVARAEEAVVLALEEEAQGGGGVEVMAIETKAGLRGAAAAEENSRDLKTFKYEQVTMEVSILIQHVADVPKNSPGSLWTAEETNTEMSRTSRSSLYAEAKESSVNMKASIEHSMKGGASFPIKAVSCSVESSLTTTASIEKSTKASSRSEETYSTETESSFTKKTTVTCSSQLETDRTDAKDQVVFKETVKLGHKRLRVKYYCRTREEFNSLKKVDEGEMTAEVGVDYVWYNIRNKYNEYLTAGAGEGGWNNVLSATISFEPHSFKQQWAWDNGVLHSRSGLYIRRALLANAGSLVMLGPQPQVGTKLTWLSNDRLRYGSGLCLQPKTFFSWIVVAPKPCSGAFKSQTWSFDEVCKDAPKYQERCARWQAEGLCTTHYESTRSYVNGKCFKTCGNC